MLINNYFDFYVIILLCSLALNIIMTIILFSLFLRKRELSDEEIEKLL